MEHIKKILRSAGIVFFGMVFARLVGYFFRIIVARTDIELYGLYNLAFVIISFIMPFIMFGLDEGILRYVSFYHGKKDKEKADIIISTALKIVLPLSILVCLILFFYSDFIAGFFHTKNLSIFLKFFAFLIPIIVLSNIFSSILKAHKKVAASIIAKEFLESLLRLLIIILSFYFGYRLLGVVSGFLIANIIALIILFFSSKKLFHFRLKGFHKKLLTFSLPILFSSIIWLIIVHTDTLMLGYFTNIKEVALYSAVVPTAQFLFIFAISFLSIFLPTITEQYAKNENVKNTYNIVTKWIILTTLPFALIMILFSNKILLGLFGQEYSVAGFSLSILAFSYFFYAFSQPAENVLVMMKKTMLRFYFILISFVINIILNLILIPRFDRLYGHGMYGAAVATGLSFLVLTIFNLKFSYKYTKIMVFNRNYLKILSAAILSFLIIYMIQKLFIEQTIWHLISFFISIIILYFVFLILFKALDEHDKLIFKMIKEKTNGKNLINRNNFK